MGDSLFYQILVMSGALLAAFGLSYLITFLLIKITSKLVFALPIFLLVVSIYFWVATLLSSDWVALGNLVIAIISVIALIGSIGSSLLIYFYKVKLKDKDLS